MELMTLEQLTAGEKKGGISFQRLNSSKKCCSYCLVLTQAIYSIFYVSRDYTEKYVVGKCCEEHMKAIKIARALMRSAKPTGNSHRVSHRERTRPSISPFTPFIK